MNTLRDHFLLAMPQLEDPHFSATLTYLCEQNAKGALGLIVNKPLSLTFGELLKQMQLPAQQERYQHHPIYRGGPMHGDRGFVLHTNRGSWKASLPVSETLSLTTSLDILEALAAGEGPEHFLIALGCAGWDAGQLERELLENTWLTCPASYDVLYNLPAEQRLAAAAASLGINLDLMSGQAGHA